jgi:hypothetical protein
MTTQTRYRAPWKCPCDKIRYDDEAAALHAAELSERDFAVPFRAYKCPGYRCWHTASRGFSFAALRTRPRKFAYLVQTAGPLAYEWLAREVGGLDGDGRPTRKFRRMVRDFEVAGLVRRDGGRLFPADRAGLTRVCMVGWGTWLDERDGAP